MAEEEDKNKYAYIPAFYFKVAFLELGVEIGDIETRFQEVSGIQEEMTVEEIEEGGINEYVHKLPKRTKFSNLVLKRALSTVPSVIAKWADNAILNYKFQLCQVNVSLMKAVKADKETKYEEVKTWHFFGAYPVKIQWSDLNAQKNDLVIETLELAFRNVTRSGEAIEPKIEEKDKK